MFKQRVKTVVVSLQRVATHNVPHMRNRGAQQFLTPVFSHSPQTQLFTQRPFHTTSSVQAQDEAVKQAKKNKKKNNQKVSIATRLLKEGKMNESLKMFDEVLSVDPDEFIALTNRAIIYGFKGKHREALQDSERAHRINAELALYHNSNLVDVHTTACQRLAKFEQLFQYANSLREIAKKYDNSTLQAHCARLMSQAVMNGHNYAGNYELALKFFEEKVMPVMAGFDQPAELWFLKAQSLLRLQRYEEALDIANTFIRDSIQLFFPIYTMANSNLGEYKLASEVFDNWEELADGSEGKASLILYHHTRAKIESMKGRTSALEHFEKALNYAKEESALDMLPDILADMALAEGVFGKKEKAKQHLQDALRIVPQHAVYTKYNFD